MTVYYAPGGGMGHLARARRVLSSLGLEGATIIATAGAGAGTIPIPAELEGDVAAHAAWLARRLDERLIVDTFPAGIQGELANLRVPRVDYVARLLKWDAYRKAVPAEAPRFHTTWTVEPLTAPHDAFVRRNSMNVVALDLTVAAEPQEKGDERYWLIVHSGPAAEVDELVAYAAELRAIDGEEVEVRVATPCPVDLPAGFRRIDAIPATHLYAGAARIVTAAGFNVMLETEPHRDRCVVMPFPRRYDDQFLRASRRACRQRPSAGS